MTQPANQLPPVRGPWVVVVIVIVIGVAVAIGAYMLFRK
jgi:hypothetical protein